MSEGSLPPFKYLDPRRYPAKLREAAGRLIERFRRGNRLDGGPMDRVDGPLGDTQPRAGDTESVTYPERRGINPNATGGAVAQAPGRTPTEAEIGERDRRRATDSLARFLAKNATNVERAARTRDQAERLERAGTPSDSARNRALRSREEVVEGLSRLRRALYASGETGAARALELEVVKLDPPVEPGEIRG